MSFSIDCAGSAFDGIVIAGGGVAGCAAAIGAARAGAKVLVLEESISLGGMASGGQLPLWMSGSLSPIQQELDRRCADTGVLSAGADRSAISDEAVKIALEDWFEELGIEFFYSVSVIGAEVQENRISSITIHHPGGIGRITAPLFIDATGDGVLAAAANVPFTLGREPDHLCQGASISFSVCGVETDAGLPDSFDVPFETPNGNAAELAKKELTPPAGHLILHKTPVKGVIAANMTNATGFDVTSASGRTAAIRLCRKQIKEIIAFFRRNLPGFENCSLFRSGSLFGVRESRHFHGMDTLTETDILSGRVFDNWISANNHFPFDLHSVSGSGLDTNGQLENFPQKYYTVALTCCLPENIRNLMLAGRNISGTHIAHASFRVMPICMNTGLGCGIAAAVSLDQGADPRDADIPLIHRKLAEQGVVPRQMQS